MATFLNIQVATDNKAGTSYKSHKASLCKATDILQEIDFHLVLPMMSMAVMKLCL
jgi:hypothetical protein